jgi:hypothetical protein
MYDRSATVQSFISTRTEVYLFCFPLLEAFLKFYVPDCCCVLFLCVVVCCCVLEGWGGLLVAMLCEQVFMGRGLVGGRAPPPPPTIM